MRNRSAPTATFTCASCEIEIAGSPTFEREVAFCCAGCAANGPCTCSYDPEPDHSSGSDRWQVRHCLDVEGALAC
jgi:hypothetical protein